MTLLVLISFVSAPGNLPSWSPMVRRVDLDYSLHLESYVTFRSWGDGLGTSNPNSPIIVIHIQNSDASNLCNSEHGRRCRLYNLSWSRRSSMLDLPFFARSGSLGFSQHRQNLASLSQCVERANEVPTAHQTLWISSNGFFWASPLSESSSVSPPLVPRSTKNFVTLSYACRSENQAMTE